MISASPWRWTGGGSYRLRVGELYAYSKVWRAVYDAVTGLMPRLWPGRVPHDALPYGESCGVCRECTQNHGDGSLWTKRQHVRHPSPTCMAPS